MEQKISSLAINDDLFLMLNPVEHENIKEQFAIKEEKSSDPLLEYVTIDQVTGLSATVFVSLATIIIFFVVRESLTSIIEMASKK